MKKKKLKFIILILVLVLLIGLLIFYSNKKYVVTTYYNDDVATTKKINVGAGTTISEIEVPQREGYRFLYWMCDGKKCKGNDKITKDIDLIAVWQLLKVKYNVEFDTGENVLNLEVTDGDFVQKPNDPLKKGYKFLGWYNDENQYDFKTPVKNSMTLKARWKKVNEYTITFNSNGGSKIEPIKVLEGSKIDKPVDPVKKQYSFIAWYHDGKKFDFNQEIDKSIVLNAMWKKNIIKKDNKVINTSNKQNVSKNKVIIEKGAKEQGMGVIVEEVVIKKNRENTNMCSNIKIKLENYNFDHFDGEIELYSSDFIDKEFRNIGLVNYIEKNNNNYLLSFCDLDDNQLHDFYKIKVFNNNNSFNSNVVKANYALGDLDYDDDIDLDDITILSGYIQQEIALDFFEKRVSDVNGDGFVNETDIDLLLLYIETNTSVFYDDLSI